MIRSLLVFLAIFAISTLTSSAQTYSLLGAGCNNKVYSVVSGNPGSNTIFAGGAFLNAGGSPVNYIAEWDGSTWTDLDGGANFEVRSMLYDNNELFVGGGFNMVGSSSTVAWGVAKWDGNSWSALGNGIRSGEIYSLINYNNSLYAGGRFDTLSGFNPGRGIMKWDGNAWTTLGGAPGDGVGGPPGFKVKALHVFNGELYVGGSFNTAGGISVSNIAKWDGTTWSAVGAGTNGEVNSFTTYNNELFVGGDFTMAGGVAVNGLAKIIGSTYSDVGGGFNGVVNDLNVYMGSLYATGAFSNAGGSAAQNIARWNGAAWGQVGLGLNFDGYALTVYDGDMYIGGFFSVAGTVFANNIVKYNIPVGLNENIQTFAFGPNPSKGIVNVTSVMEMNKTTVYVTDLSGRLVYEQDINEILPNENLSFDLTFLQPGLYNISFKNQDAVQSFKMFID